MKKYCFQGVFKNFLLFKYKTSINTVKFGLVGLNYKVKKQNFIFSTSTLEEHKSGDTFIWDYS